MYFIIYIVTVPRPRSTQELLNTTTTEYTTTNNNSNIVGVLL